MGALPIPDNSLWRFDPDGQGAGTWTPFSVPSEFSRVSNALYTSGNSIGYLFGGYRDERTAPDLKLTNWPSSPGLISYNMAADEWTNQTSYPEGSHYNGGSPYRVNGYLDFIPTFGSHGILIALGGCSSNASHHGLCRDIPANSFTTIDIYDLSQRRWYSQTASNAPGQLPDPREGFCGVGLPGDDGTYEIFIFGGGLSPTGDPEDRSVQNYLDAVYVLSLPAFVWHKADYRPNRARFKHSCNIVGKRQMLVVGGIHPFGNLWLPKDPWAQGLNVFDLTEMKWKEKYDADAQSYVTPGVVKSWYKDNEMYPRWDNHGLEKIFTVSVRCKSSLSHPSGGWGFRKDIIFHYFVDSHSWLAHPSSSSLR